MLAYVLPVCGRIDFDLLCGLPQTAHATLAAVVAAPLVLDSLPLWLRDALPPVGEGFWMVLLAVACFILGAVLLLGAVRRSRRTEPDAMSLEPELLELSEPRPARPSGLRGRPQAGGPVATARSDEPMGDEDQPMPETKIESTLFSHPPTREVVGWIVFQDRKGTRIPITLRSFRIGRHPDNDVVLENRTVHRFHATMQMDGDGTFTITDVGTLNKVFVNRKAYRDVALRSGDLVQLGEVRFKFYPGSEGPPRGHVDA